MQLDPATGLAEYPAAFVGTLVDVSGQIGVVFSSDTDTIYRFQVEQWVKGDLGDFVDVHSAADGGACGIEVGIGNRAGVFLSVESGQLSSSLCSTIDADVLLAGAEPLVVGAPGPGILLASGNIGGYNYVVLNEEGGIVAGINGPFNEPFEQPWQFSICPGGDVLVEQWSRGLVLRDLTDLSIIRQVDLSDFAETTGFLSMRCVSVDGSEVLVAGEEWTGSVSVSRVFKVSDTIEPWIEVPLGQVWLGDTLAVVQSYESNEISVVEYESGSINAIHATPSSEDGPYTGIAGISISPDASSIALMEVLYEGPEGGVSDLILFDNAGTELGRQQFAGEASSLNWLDANRILINWTDNEGRGQVATVLNATTLETAFEIKGWQGWNPVIIDQRMYASEGGTIVSADLSTGEVSGLGTLPTQFVGPIAVLPADFKPSLDLIGDNPEVNPPATVPPLVSDEFGSGEALDVTNTARIVLVVLAVGAIVAFVLTRRKPEVKD